MTKKQFEANMKYLTDCEVFVERINTKNSPYACTLENYSKGGGDMVITLDELSKESLLRTLGTVNINAVVISWWPNGYKLDGVPFKSIKHHYNDVERWLKDFYKIAEKMPY
jgi:hypothetical protein